MVYVKKGGKGGKRKGAGRKPIGGKCNGITIAVATNRVDTKEKRTALRKAISNFLDVVYFPNLDEK